MDDDVPSGMLHNIRDWGKVLLTRKPWTFPLVLSAYGAILVGLTVNAAAVVLWELIPWRRGREADGARLESERPFIGSAGSNPAVSANLEGTGMSVFPSGLLNRRSHKEPKVQLLHPPPHQGGLWIEKLAAADTSEENHTPVTATAIPAVNQPSSDSTTSDQYA